MEHGITPRAKEKLELYATRLGVRTIDFTFAWQVASWVGPYINAWGEARGLPPLASMPMHEFVGALSTMTALYEAAVRYRVPFFPTISEIGLEPREPYVEPEHVGLERDVDRDLVRDSSMLPWSR